jgi:hypothetical protein
MNLQRKLERKDISKKRKEAKKKLATKVKSIFLPDKCSFCPEPFDRKSKEMSLTWFVMAKGEDKVLLCPSCWAKLSVDNPNEA